MEQCSLFGLSEHLERLSNHGDPLEVLDGVVDFEFFRGWLVDGLGYGCAFRGYPVSDSDNIRSVNPI
jgi:transposase, IS5 family